MSPCTAKLGLLKGKKFARVAGGGGVGDGGRGGFGRGYSIGGVRRLFGGRVVVREEEQAVKSKEMVKGENEQENEDTEMEMEKD